MRTHHRWRHQTRYGEMASTILQQDRQRHYDTRTEDRATDNKDYGDTTHYAQAQDSYRTRNRQRRTSLGCR